MVFLSQTCWFKLQTMLVVKLHFDIPVSSSNRIEHVRFLLDRDLHVRVCCECAFEWLLVLSTLFLLFATSLVVAALIGFSQLLRWGHITSLVSQRYDHCSRSWRCYVEHLLHTVKHLWCPWPWPLSVSSVQFSSVQFSSGLHCWLFVDWSAGLVVASRRLFWV